MTVEPTFQPFCFNLFAKDSYITLIKTLMFNVYSVETSYLLPCEINNRLKDFSSETFSFLHLNIKSMNRNFETFQGFRNP